MIHYKHFNLIPSEQPESANIIVIVWDEMVSWE